MIVFQLEKKRISSPDITVLVQGPVTHPEVDWINCIQSIHKHLPNAKIISVMWDTDRHKEVKPDVVLRDPGPTEYNGYTSNLRRQALAISRGLSEVKTTFTLKLRPDFALVSDSFCEGAADWKKGVVRTLNVYSLNPEKSAHYFWLSDLVQFGLTADLQDYWNLEASPLSQFKIDKQSRVSNLLSPWGGSSIAKSPEQVIASSWLQSKGYKILEWQDGSIRQNRRNYETNLRALSDHFDVVPWFESGLKVPKRFQLTSTDLITRKSKRQTPYILSMMLRWRSWDYLLSRVSGLLMFFSPILHSRVRAMWIRKRHGA